MKLSSKKLYAALAGHKVDADKMHCAGRKKALKTSGTCAYYGVAAAKGSLYRSPFALAKGTPMSAELVAACPQQCEQCKAAHKNSTRCEKCGVGFVAGRMFKDKSDYKAARAAFTTLKKAADVSGKCEACAVALVTDGTCSKCNVRLEDGRIAG